MKKTAFLWLCAGTLFSATATAQDETDALRYSRTFHGGTARFSAMGGAFAALGGDPSTLAFNPAGIGVYRSSEFSITPNLTYSGTTSSFMGNKLADDRYQFGLSNIAGIGVINIDHSNGLTQLNIGFASNRHNVFSARTLTQGKPVPYGDSYLSYFTSLANSNDPNIGGVSAYVEREQDLAWHTNMLTRDTLTGRYYPALDSADFTESRRNTETWGSIREVNFSLGGNVSNVFYFGVSVGIQSASYSKDLTDVDESLSSKSAVESPYIGSTYNKTYRVQGTGYNFKAGFIARPFAYADFLNGLRIGAAIHTPTFLSMDDSYVSNMSASTFIDSVSRINKYATLNAGEFGYALQTPFKFMAGLAYTFGVQGSQWRGIVSADYEYANYSKMKMRPNGFSNGYAFVDENMNIATYYKSTHNLRLGGELGFGKVSLRGGYAYYASPYTASVGKNGDTHVASAGIGIRGAHTYLDFAYARLMQQDKEYFYNSEGKAFAGEEVRSAPIAYDIIQSSFVVTFGVRF